MKQHKKKSDLYKWYVSVPKDLYEWFRDTAKAEGKSQGLYLTEILEILRKLKGNAQ